MRALLLSLIAIALSAQRAYPCVEPILTDEAITPDGTAIPNGGGVVVMTVNGSRDSDEAEGARLMAGTTNVELRRDYIAPALTVIVAKPQANRAIELVGMRGKTIIRLTQSDVQPKHTAPKLAKAHSTFAPIKTAGARTMWEPSSQYTVELAEDPPADVLALVVFVKDNGVAWARPQKGQRVYSFWAGGKRCSPGPSTVAQGELVTVAWLDNGGRLSLKTKELKVGVTPKAKQP